MRQAKYNEGRQAQKKFEEGMKALFKVPKDEVVKAEKRKAKNARASRRHKKKQSDGD